MSVFKYFVQNIQDRFFDSVVTNHLVYNACWEDPSIDRPLLDIRSDSSIVMLTSAGCNALDYLLDDPKAIFTVDANANQTALLELKKAFFNHGDHNLLFDFFGTGSHPEAHRVYEKYLKQYLTLPGQRFWNNNLNYFSGGSSDASFYFRGTSGKIALLFHREIKRKGLYKSALSLLNATSLEEQKYHFEEIDPLLWSGFFRWLLRQDVTMALLGVPGSQRDLIERYQEGGLYRFIKSSLLHVFTEVPTADNYFWRVYITGSYTRECCPNYLKEHCFELIKGKIDRVHPFTATLSDFLERHPGSYSHFVLLDHQDWISDNRPGKLSREWNLILKNARPGARILFRSAGEEVHFLPEFVHRQVDFHPSLCEHLHRKDRVGTYGSTHLGVVRK